MNTNEHEKIEVTCSCRACPEGTPLELDSRVNSGIRPKFSGKFLFVLIRG